MMRLASSASRAQWTWPPARVQLLLELLEVDVEMAQHVLLDLRGRDSRSSSQSGISPTTSARLARITSVAWRTLRAQLRVGERGLRRRPETPARVGRVADADHRRGLAGSGATRGSRRGAGSGRPARCAAQPAADLHQAGVVGRRADLGAGFERRSATLSASHRGRDVGVLDREGAAEAAALVVAAAARRASRPRTALQQPRRLVAEMQRAQRVAGRVERDVCGNDAPTS